MKNFGKANLHTNGTEITRVYLHTDGGDNVEISTRCSTMAGLRPAGYVDVGHDSVSVGTGGDFAAAIIDAARRFLIAAEVVREYETVCGSIEYEMA